MTSATLLAHLRDPDRTEILAQVVRSGVVESIHHGIVAAQAADGTMLFSRGDTELPIYPRSANKPMQTAAMVRCGLQLEPELLALASASHSGEPGHLEGARRILATVGLDEDALQNTPDHPIDDAERERWIVAGRARCSLAQNCSGKHAAMIATCVVNGWDRRDYRNPNHPLQRAIAETIAELAGEPIAGTGVDGCGAPVLAISTKGLATAFGVLAAAEPTSAEGQVAEAIRHHPWYLGGTGRDVTTLIEGVEGLITKDGAEAVQAIGLPNGTGVALKIADGGQRARPVVVAATLAAIGLTGYDEVLSTMAEAPILGHGEQVGAVSAVGF